MEQYEVGEKRGTHGESCGQSLERHVLSLVGTLAESGAGGACPDVYRALIETAEGLRARGSFPVHVPTPAITNDFVTGTFKYLVSAVQVEEALDQIMASGGNKGFAH